MKKIFFIFCLFISLASKAQDSSARLQKKYDSVLLVLKAKNFRLNRVKFYLNICLKNPRQDKYLKGWIRRALQ